MVACVCQLVPTDNEQTLQEKMHSLSDQVRRLVDSMQGHVEEAQITEARKLLTTLEQLPNVVNKVRSASMRWDILVEKPDHEDRACAAAILGVPSSQLRVVQGEGQLRPTGVLLRNTCTYQDCQPPSRSFNQGIKAYPVRRHTPMRIRRQSKSTPQSRPSCCHAQLQCPPRHPCCTSARATRASGAIQTSWAASAAKQQPRRKL